MESLKFKQDNRSDQPENISGRGVIASMENLEPRLMLTGAWDNISEIFLEQGTYYSPDVVEPTGYGWEIGFDSVEGSVASARFRPESITDGWVSITDSELDEDGEEWFYEMHFTDPLELEGYLYESFVLELSFEVGDVLSTSIALTDGDGSALAAPTATPVITNLFQNETNVALDTALSWDSVAGANVTGLEVEVGEYLPVDPQGEPYYRPMSEVAEFEYESTQTNTDALSLQADKLYGAHLLFDNAYEGTTIDGVATFASRYVESSVDFNTYSTLLDPIDSVYYVTGSDSTNLTYGMEFGMESSQTDWFDIARIKTPTGNWFELDQQELFAMGGAEWYFEFTTSDSMQIEESFPAGVYELEIDYGDFVMARTSFDVSDPDDVSGTPLPAPSESPVFTDPLDGASDVATDVSFAWDAVTDTAVDSIELEVSDNFEVEPVDVDLAPDQTSFDQTLLSEGTEYSAELSFWNITPEQTNPEGISFEVGTYTMSSVAFTTAGEVNPTNPVLENISDVSLQLGLLHNSDGSTTYMVEFILSSNNTGWFDTAEISTGDGSWLALVPDMLPPESVGEGEPANVMYSWRFIASDSNLLNLAAYTAGQYALRFTLSDQSTVTTDFTVTGLTMGVSETPAFTYPQADQSGVETQPTLTWTAPTDAAVDYIMCEVSDQYGVFFVPVESSWDSGSISGDMSLAPDSTYSASLTFVDDGAVQTNDDGVPYRFNSYQSSWIDFSTTDEVDPLANIDEIYIEHGVFTQDGVSSYWFEGGFDTQTIEWFTSARLQGPDSNWYDLAIESMDGGQIYGAFYEFESSQEADLAGYGDGSYTLEITLEDSSIITTSFEIGGVAAPVQQPAFIAPMADQGDVPPDTAIQWDAVSDSNVTMIELVVTDTSDNDVVDEYLAPATTHFDQAQLESNSSYVAELGFYNEAVATNSDGVNILTARSTSTEINFSTGDFAPVVSPLEHILAVDIERGVITTDYDTSYLFEFIVELDEVNFFSMLEVSPNSTNWYSLNESAHTGVGEGELEPDTIEYVFEQWGISEQDLSSFVDGNYTLRFTMEDSSTVETTFSASGLNSGASQSPVFTNPLTGATDVAVDVAYAWEAVSDASVTTVELFVVNDFYEEVIDEEFGVDQTGYDPEFDLASGSNYKAELSFFADGPELLNSDDISFRVNNYQSREILFTTAGEFDPLDNIDEAFIEQGAVDVDGATYYWFEGGFESYTSEWFTSARLQSPDSSWHDLVIELDDDPQSEGCEAFFELISQQETDFAGFGDGSYVFEITLEDSSVITTSFSVGGVAAPTQQPSFTAPLADAVDVATDISFIWDAVTDTNVSLVELEVYDTEDQDYVDVMLMPDVTQFDQALLEGNAEYNAELAFINESFVANTDGVNLLTVRALGTLIQFSTAGEVNPVDPVLANINDVVVELGAVHLSDGSTEYELEFVVGSSTTGWFETVEISTGDGNWQALTADDAFSGSEDGGDGGEYYSWRFKTASTNLLDLAAYMAGQYALRFTLDDASTVTTDFTTSALSIGVTETPAFTYPAQGQSDVSVQPTFTWTAPTDAVVNYVLCEVYDEIGGGWFFIPVDQSLASAAMPEDMSLLSESDYTVELVFGSDGDNQYNEDGVPYRLNTYQVTELDFTTEQVTDPLMNIDNVFIGQGVVNVDGGVLYWFEAGFESYSSDWFTAARIQSPDSNWHNLTIETEDYGCEAEFEFESSQISDLAGFGDGVYVLEITVNGSDIISTSFDVGGVTAPTQLPTFIAPMDDQGDIDPDISFQWDAVTDTNVTMIEFIVDDSTDGEWIDEMLTPGSTQFDQDVLPTDTSFMAELGFFNESYGPNSDGVNFITARAVSTVIEFSTGDGQPAVNPLEHVLGVDIERGIIQDTYEGGYTFEFIVMLDSNDFFDYMEVSPDGESWYTLAQDYDDYMYAGSEDDIEDIEYCFEQWGQSEEDLSDFSDGVYTLRFTMPDSSQIETTFNVSGLSNTLSEMPTFTSPLDGAAAFSIGDPFTWQAAVDSSITEIELFVDTDGYVNVLDLSLASDATSYDPDFDLVAGMNYLAELTFFADGQEQTSNDGLGFKVNSYTSSVISFTTGGDFNIADLMTDVYFEQGVLQIGQYASESGQVEYEYFFDFGFTTPTQGWFTNASLVTPGGEYWSVISDPYAEQSPYDWFVALDGEDASFLDAFGTGTYSLELYLASGSPITLEFDVDSGIAVPSEYPEILNPADGSDNIPVSGSLSWTAASDSTVDMIYAELELLEEEGDDVEFENIDSAATSVDYSDLQEASSYLAEVDFIDGALGVNTDGISYTAAMTSGSVTRFNTYSPWSNVYNIAVDQGVSVKADGTHYQFSVEMAVEDLDWIASATVTVPGGAVIDLAVQDEFTPVSEGEDDESGNGGIWGVKLDSTNPMDALAFGAGDYTLTLTLADSSVISTVFTVDANDAVPTQIPNISYPVSGADDVLLDPVYTWDAVSDDAVAEIWLTIIGENGEFIDSIPLEADQSSYQRDLLLAFNNAYEVQVSFHSSNQEPNEDDIFVQSSSYTASQVEFSTVASNLSVTQYIDGLEFFSGSASDGEQATTSPGMVRIFSQQSDWIDTIEISSDGSTWVTLEHTDMGEYGHSWELLSEDLAISTGSAALRFNLPGGESETTDFTMAISQLQTPAIAQLTTPASATEPMDPEEDISWANPGETVEHTEVLVMDLEGNIITKMYADSDTTEIQSELEPNTEYKIVVQHYSQGEDLVNDDGVMCRYGTFSQLSSGFVTGNFSNIWKMVDVFDIVKGQVVLPNGDIRYMLEINLESAYEGWYTAAWARASSSASYDDAHALTFVTDSHGEDDYYASSLEIFSDDPQAVVEFNDGKWWLQIETEDGIEKTTLIVDGLDDIDLPTPVITSPANGAVSVLPFTPITWEPIDDSDVTGIVVRIIDSSENLVVDEELPADATEFVPVGLDLDQQYTLQVVAVGSENSQEHDEGFEYLTVGIQGAQINYTTAASANVWDLVSQVELQRRGDSFEVMVSTPVAGWFESAEIQDTAGNWHMLELEDKDNAGGDGLSDGDSEAQYGFSIDLDSLNIADFAAGTYNVRITLVGGSEFTTSVQFDPELDEPSEIPVFIAPAGDQQGVEMESLITWQQVTDSEIDAIWLEVTGPEGLVMSEVLDSQAVSQAVTLLGDTGYSARLTFVNTNSVTSTDGLTVNNTWLSETEINFQTESPMTDIFEVFIDQGIEYSNGSDPVYIIEIGFDALSDAVTSARFRRDAELSSWITLDSETEEFGEDNEYWGYEVEGDSADDLALWLDASWIFEFTFANGQVFSTALAQADSQSSGEALIQPTQIPVFENLVADGTYRDGYITPQWSAIVDANVTSQELELSWADGSDEYESENTDLTSLAEMELMANEVYFASLLWDNARTGQTDEGVDFFVTKYVENSIEFNTYAGMFDSLSEIGFQSSEVVQPDGSTVEIFGFEIASYDNSQFDKAELVTPDGYTVELLGGEQIEEAYVWSFVAAGDLSHFAYGDYTLVLTNDEVSASSVFAITSETAALPADAPSLTSPANGDADVRPNASFSWTAPTDPNTYAVMLKVMNETGMPVIDQMLSASETELQQYELGFESQYMTELSFVNSYTLTSDLGVGFTASTSRTELGSFSTAQALNPIDVINDVYIERGLMDIAGGTDLALEFGFGILTVEADQIMAASLETPTGVTYDLTAVDASDPDVGYEWLLQVESVQSVSNGFGDGELVDFTTGVYTLTLAVNELETVSTSFLLDASIAAPAIPQFTDPIYGADTVSPSVRFEWNAITDAANLALVVTDLDSGEDLISTALDPYATRYTQSLLQGAQSYSADLLAANGYANLANADGVNFSVSMYSGQRIEFMTIEPFNPLAMISDVSFSRGFISEAAATNIAFSFAMDLDSDQVAAMRLQTPDGQWYDITEDGLAASPDDLAGFTSGFYTLEITSTDAQVVTTSFELGGMQAPLAATMTNMADGQLDYDSSTPISWIPSTSEGVDNQLIIVTNTDTNEVIAANLLPANASQYDAGLDYDSSYTVEIMTIVDGQMQTNEDGVAFSLSNFASRKISFTTAVEFNPLENIDSVDIHMGMINPVNDMYSDWFILDMQLNIPDGIEFEALEYAIDGVWYSSPDSQSIVFSTTDTQQRDLILNSDAIAIRITHSGGQQVETSIPLPGSGAIPAAAVSLVSPDGENDVMPDAAITWTTDGAAPLSVLVCAGAFSEVPDNIIFETELAADAVSVTPEGLEYLSDYTVYAGQTASDSGTSTDGLNYETSIVNFTAVEFSTVEASVDLIPTLGDVTGLTELNLWGDSGAATVTIENTGTSTASGTATVSLYFSEDPWYDAEDAQIGSTSSAISLASGQTVDIDVNIAVDQQLDTGEYYLVAVVSTNDAVVEDSVTNNEIAGDIYNVAAPVVDLTGEVKAVEFESEGRVIAGESGAVQVEVVNAGNISASGSCTVQIYASTSSSYDSDGILVGSRSTTLALPADGGVTLTIAIEIPDETPTDFYYFYAVVDSDERIDEVDEDNNVAAWDSPVSIEAQIVDFTGVITTQSFGAATLAGTSGTVDMTLVNQGNWPIRKSVAVILYASTTGDIDAQAVQIGKGTAKLNLDSDGDAQDVTIKAKLPKDMADGDYYIVAAVDSSDAVEERNELNNTLVSDTTISIVEPFVDLSGEISDDGYAGFAVAGDEARVIVTVTNNGNVTAKQSKVLITLYASETLDIADGVQIASQKVSINLKTSDSKEFTLKSELPADMTTGFYYLIAVIDADAEDAETTGGVVEESSEMNNTAIADVQLEVQEQMIDLTATLGESTLHSSPMPGMSGKVEVIIANDGNVYSGPADVTVKIYGSLDDTAVADEDMLLGEISARKLNLAPGANKTVTVNVTVPEDAVSELYNLIVVVDSEDIVAESVEDNNQLVADEGFEVVEPFVDVSAVMSEIDLPESVLPGDSGKITVTLTNEGNITAKGLVTITLYASDSEVKDVGTEIELATMTAKINLSAGAAKDYSAKIVMLDEIEQLSDLYILAHIDPADELADTDDANNLAVSSGPVLEDPVRDLVGELTSYDLMASIITGDRISAKVTVANEGNVSATGDLELGIYALAVGDPGAIPILIGEAIVDSVSIAPGRSLKYSFRVEVPAGLDAGVDYQFYVDIDSTDVIDEVNEDNNTLDMGDPVTYVQRFGTFDGHKNESLSLTDDLGTQAEFTMTGDGYGEVTTNDDGLFVVTITGTTAKSKFTIRSADDEFASVYSISADSDLGTIDAETTDLADGGSITILGSLGMIEMHDVADQHELTIGSGDSQKTTMTFNDVTDLNITTDTPIQSLSVNSWTDTDGDDLISAPWIGTLDSTGDFTANLLLSGEGVSRSDTLAKATIGGSVDDGDDSDTDWDISGEIGTVTLSGTVDNFSVTGDSVNALMLGDADSINLDIDGPIASVRADSLADGQFSATEIKTITATGSFGADLMLSSDDMIALGSVKAGALDYDDPDTVAWDIAGGIGNINADSADNLRIQASGGIKSVTIGDVTDTSLGDDGASVGEVKLVKVDSWDGGEIVADSITSLNTTGDFSADMTVGTGDNTAFKTVKINGGITGGLWTVSGDMGALSVGGDLADWTLDLGDAALKTFRLGSATNTSISAGDIGTIKSDAWLGGTITADSVKSVYVAGDADVDMAVTGDVGTVKATGDMLGGDWNVGGTVKSVAIAGDATIDMTVTGDVSTFKASGDADVDMAVTGDVGTFKVSGDMLGGDWNVGGTIKSMTAASFTDLDVTADIIKTMSTAGDMADSSVALTSELAAKVTALNKLTVSGTMSSSAIRSVGNMGTITVGKMEDSVVFAGVKSDYTTDENSDGVLDLPVMLDDFVSPDADVLAQIKSLTIKGSKTLTTDLFDNSSVAAGKITKATVKEVTTDNSGQAFGFSAVESIKLSWQQGKTKYTFGKTWADDDGDFTVMLAQDAPGSQWFNRA